jgi:hypothetical protein
MSARICVFIACRFFAFYVFYVALVRLVEAYATSAISYIMMDVDQHMEHATAWYDISVRMVLGLFFWIKADWLSTRIAGRYAATPDTNLANFKLEDIQLAAFGIIGLVVTTNALAPYGNLIWLAYNFDSLSKGMIGNGYHDRVISDIVTGTFWLCGGLFIFFKAPCIANAFWRHVNKTRKPDDKP